MPSCLLLAVPHVIPSPETARRSSQRTLRRCGLGVSHSYLPPFFSFCLNLLGSYSVELWLIQMREEIASLKNMWQKLETVADGGGDGSGGGCGGGGSPRATTGPDEDDYW